MPTASISSAAGPTTSSKVSGQWVYPLEVELCLADHPAVRECAVLAVKQDSELIALKAFVVLNDKAASDSMTRTLQDYVKGKLLPTSTRAWWRIWTTCRRPAPAKSTAKPCQVTCHPGIRRRRISGPRV